MLKGPQDRIGNPVDVWKKGFSDDCYFHNYSFGPADGHEMNWNCRTHEQEYSAGAVPS